MDEKQLPSEPLAVKVWLAPKCMVLKRGPPRGMYKVRPQLVVVVVVVVRGGGGGAMGTATDPLLGPKWRK